MLLFDLKIAADWWGFLLRIVSGVGGPDAASALADKLAPASSTLSGWSPARTLTPGQESDRADGFRAERDRVEAKATKPWRMDRIELIEGGIFPE
jgi:hypothetical protein